MKVFDLAIRMIMNPQDLYHWQQLMLLLGQGSAEGLGIPVEKSRNLCNLLAEGRFAWMCGAVRLISDDGTFDFDAALKSLQDNVPAEMDDDGRYLLGKDIDEWEKHWKKFKTNVPREQRSLVSFRNAVSVGSTQIADNESGVALLTAHTSKGLEFEVVFIIGLSEGTFPDYRAVKAGADALTQEKNSMYVALTRAKRLCYLSYPKKKKTAWNGSFMNQDPSRFIKGILERETHRNISA